MRTITKTLVIASLLAVGCAGNQDTESTTELTPSEALRALGIDRLVVAETGTQLTIEGYAATGESIANLELVLGRFTMTVEPERGEVDGRSMNVSVLGKSTLHESEGRGDLSLPAPRDPAIQLFTADAAIAETLIGWGISFEPPEPEFVDEDGGEAPYLQQCFNGGLGWVYSGYGGCEDSPYGGCTSYQSKRFDRGDGEYGEFRCCSSTYNERRCKGPQEQTGCGWSGNGGCAVCWSDPLADGYCRVTGGGGECRMEFCG